MPPAAGVTSSSLAVGSADGAATPRPQRLLRSLLTAEQLAEEDHELAMMEQNSLLDEEAAIESEYATGLIVPSGYCVHFTSKSLTCLNVS